MDEYRRPVALDRFSEPVRTWFETTFAEPTAGAGAGVAGDRRRGPHADPGPDGLGEDAGRLPLGDRPADDHAASGDGGAAGPLHLAAASAGGRRGEEPAGTAAGHRPRGGAAGAHGPRPDGGHADRRHARRRAAQAGAQPARPAHHHARVALPHAHLGGAGDAGERRDGDHRRDPRPGGHEAGDAPGPHAGAPRGADGDAAAAHRAVGHAAAAGRDRPLPGRSGRRDAPAGDGRRRRGAQADGDRGRGPRRGHGPPRRDHRRARRRARPPPGPCAGRSGRRCTRGCWS